MRAKQWLPLLLALPLAAEPARVWEASLVIPTYELGPPDPLPVFPYAARRRPIYPYPLLDAITDRRVEKSYRAVMLENEYLKVTVLPELGGHLYAIYDKTAGRDVLYTNHVVKYGLVGIRGAWISGGIEWNFPDGHTATTVSPVDYILRSEPDGSACVVVGDTERIQRMQWAVAIRLHPGCKAVQTEVRLNNRREIPGRYWFWATAAAPAADDMRFVYPMREAYPHVFWPVFSFPEHRGMDLSLYRSVPNALSLFARNSYRDFLGVYYEKSDWGIVHVADHRQVAGKKTWTWGTADSGAIWVEKLTDQDGQYVEFQAGRFETQMEHEFLAPHRVEAFTHYWYPVNKLGGPFTEANREAALRLAREGERLRLTLNVNRRLANAELLIEEGGRRLASRRADLDPATPFSALFDAPARTPLTVRLLSAEGRELLRYRTDTPVDGNPEFQPAAPPASKAASAGAEEAYLQGLAADRESRELQARAAYQKALERDPGFTPAHTALGLSYYRTGEYARAAEHLAAALRRNPRSEDAHYYLGLVRRAQGRAREAADHLWWCVRAGHREAVARYVLGEMALAAGDLAEALEHLEQAVLLEPRDLKARTVLAMAERLAGRTARARERIQAVLEEMPIDYLALSEQVRILAAAGAAEQAGRAREQLWRLLAREPDSLLELAFDYLACGRRQEAAEALEEGLRRRPNHPIAAYALGRYEAAAQADPSYVFPHRVEEIALLEQVRRARPSDGRAAYYLGNALAGNYRLEEAVAAWREAVRLEPSNAAAHRNLGQALARQAGSEAEAADAYRRAISLWPQEHRLYLELDRVLARRKQTEGRVKLLEGAPAAVRARSPVIQALAEAYTDAGRYREAIALLEKTRFVTGEGETSALALYRRACRDLAGELRQAGRHEEAARAFLRAAEYPRNLGVGRPPVDETVGDWVSAAQEFEAAGNAAEAERLWRRAAGAVVELASEPGKPSAELARWKAMAAERLAKKQEVKR
jgi:tetratricopeptide (TPR) repeat protein